MKISYGLVCGYTSGFALKKVGKASAIVIGKFNVKAVIFFFGFVSTENWRSCFIDFALCQLCSHN